MPRGIRNPNVYLNEETGCRVCWKPASGRNYGVVSCSACKMFFRRVSVESLVYNCRQSKNCYDNLKIFPKCKYCRFQKCLRMGMQLIPDPQPMLPDQLDKLNVIMKGMIIMEEDRYRSLTRTYSVEDPTLEDVLRDRSLMKLTVKTSDVKVGPHEWAFLDVFSWIQLVSQCDFFTKLDFYDQRALFSANYLPIALLTGAMATMNNGRDKLLTPDGEDVYPDEVRELFTGNPEILDSICTTLVGTLIKLRVTKEECLLLTYVFLCNPALCTVSNEAQKTLKTFQEELTSRLFAYCQVTYQKAAPTRFLELLSIFNVMNKTNSDLQYVSMMFQLGSPGFGFKKLVYDVFVQPGISS
ncbi:hypothetical protein B9Z55_023408 [Caenorhabditis nigoni]|uniref:Nuclear receptor domain-containing protein n=1 Tax=Caenorhabditis nigoni TaxID=1611254 RepID=A0A2G5SQ74_9PELO|nr:hypothetical protein B9Z55_023408 [Caenorhabditis nigoni]